MDFNFSETQTMLRDSLKRFLADRYGFEQRQKMLAHAQGRDPGIWKAFAGELGILGAGLPEADGGFGGGAIDHMVIMEELGGSIAIEPYVPTIVIGAKALAGTSMVADIIAGDMIIAAAFLEAQSRDNLANVRTTATKDGGGWKLSGQKSVVIAAPYATHLLVSARTGGGPYEANGLSLFLLAADAPGITMRPYPTVDGFMAAEIAFDNVALGADALLGDADGAHPVLSRLWDDATIATAAEATGVMRRLNEMTGEYARQRKQFGRAIAEFQVLQHRMVDMFMEAEQAMSMTLMGSLRLDEPERAKWVSQAKLKINHAARFVGQQAVQIHGGIGITHELAAGHYFKRLSIIENQFGDSDYHFGRLDEALLAEPA